jgi:hypothetical protein
MSGIFGALLEAVMDNNVDYDNNDVNDNLLR